MRTLPWCLSACFSMQFTSWSAKVLWRFRRSCSCQDDCGICYACAVLGRNLGQQKRSLETPVIITSIFAKVLESAYWTYTKNFTIPVHEI